MRRLLQGGVAQLARLLSARHMDDFAQTASCSSLAGIVQHLFKVSRDSQQGLGVGGQSLVELVSSLGE